MRRAKRTFGNETHAGWQQAGHRMDGRNLERFVEAEQERARKGGNTRHSLVLSGSDHFSSEPLKRRPDGLSAREDHMGNGSGRFNPA